ncbi:MAG: phosphoglycerate kinase [Bdellovibrionaceae bacterium]|nr:phosphoglycerate kinase [Pseudobdellovibrionaceae bacterium]
MGGLRGIKTIRDFELDGKTLFLRLDLNVPLEKGKITDETRITASIPTIRLALEKGAKVVMASHLGRPKSPEDTQFSLEPVAERLSELLGMDVILAERPDSEAMKTILGSLKKNQLILLENVRFEKGETENSDEYAQKLAGFTDVYINDAFGASHRAHATIDALPRLIKQRGIGLLIEKEIKMLDQLLENPARPYVAILGGSKVSDKIDVIENLIDRVDAILIGGAMAYTFLKAKGLPVGKSLVEMDKVNYARELIARIEARDKTLLLPVDHKVTPDFNSHNCKSTAGQGIEEGMMGIDIGPQTVQQFTAAIKEAKTVFWNGPMGVFEKPAFAEGTFAIAKALAANEKAFRIVGGGDSAAAAEQSGYADKMTHISTGGGASLEYLQGDKLPGLEVLRERIRN